MSRCTRCYVIYETESCYLLYVIYEILSESNYNYNKLYPEYRNSSLSFSARRGTSDYKTEDSFITYDLIEVNQENCLEKKTGIFKAPFQGTYLFTFNAISGANGVTHVLLCKNNKYGSCQSFNRGTTTAYHTNLALTAIWPLNVNDTVGVMLIEGALHDDSSTTFCGVLLGKN